MLIHGQPCWGRGCGHCVSCSRSLSLPALAALSTPVRSAPLWPPSLSLPPLWPFSLALLSPLYPIPLSLSPPPGSGINRRRWRNGYSEIVTAAGGQWAGATSLTSCHMEGGYIAPANGSHGVWWSNRGAETDTERPRPFFRLKSDIGLGGTRGVHSRAGYRHHSRGRVGLGTGECSAAALPSLGCV